MIVLVNHRGVEQSEQGNKVSGRYSAVGHIVEDGAQQLGVVELDTKIFQYVLVCRQAAPSDGVELETESVEVDAKQKSIYPVNERIA